MMGSEKGYWRIATSVWASEKEAYELEDRIARLLCPEPDHAPPCPIPWEIAVEPLTEPDELAQLSIPEQVHHESSQD